MDYLNLVWILLISLGINYFFFVFAAIFKSDVFTDITYALSFSLISIIFFIWGIVKNGEASANQVFVFFFINVWAGQLGAYLFTRILKLKVDHRFDGIRESFVKFLGFWTIQAFTVFIVIAPMALFFMADPDSNFGSLILLLAAAGLAYEMIADHQKRKFYKEVRSKNPNAFLNTGLWKDSRHPNYVGEVTFWSMMTLSCMVSFWVENNDGVDFVYILAIASPIFLFVLIYYISGVKKLELAWEKKYEKNQAFHKYVMNSSIFLPYIGPKGYWTKSLNRRKFPKTA